MYRRSSLSGLVDRPDQTRASRIGAAQAPVVGDHKRGDEPDVLFDPNAVFLSRSALAGHGLGDTIAFVVDGRAQTFRIAGTVPGAADRALAVIDVASAQDRFGRLGRIDRIDLKLAEGAEALIGHSWNDGLSVRTASGFDGCTNPLRGRGVCGAVEVMERALRLD